VRLPLMDILSDRVGGSRDGHDDQSVGPRESGSAAMRMASEDSHALRRGTTEARSRHHGAGQPSALDEPDHRFLLCEDGGTCADVPTEVRGSTGLTAVSTELDG